MTTIQRLLSFKLDQLALTRLAIKQLERKLEELELQSLQSKLIYFPNEMKN